MRKRLIIAVLLVLGAGATLWYIHVQRVQSVITLTAVHATTATAIFGGGCFWCVEADFEKVPGVVSVVSGYTGGATENPTYKNYAAGGHREVVEVTYDPAQVSYLYLVASLIAHSDPTDSGGSFGDRGSEYAPAIYFATPEEKKIADNAIALLDKGNGSLVNPKIYEKPLAVAVLPRAPFWPAEEYHQDYYKKNPIRYQYYRNASGRDAFIQRHENEQWPDLTKWILSDIGNAAPLDGRTAKRPPWNDMPFRKIIADDGLRAYLTPLQYAVTQEGETEPPFDNAYNDNKAAGIYVDVFSGEPLYSSRDKFDSGTGWPSFVQPITPTAVTLHEDRGWFTTRTEVRSAMAGSHLGHVFNDGPADRGGRRFCMNSAALRFVPKENMEHDGYGDYLQFVE